MNNPIRYSIVLTLSLVLMTQAFFLPVILSCLFLAVIFLFYIYSKRQKRISKVITFSIVCVALLSIFFSFKTFLGVEAGVSVLSTFLFAKALETKAKRDVIVLFNFALFVSASSFLYSQAAWMAALIFMCFMSCLIGLYRLQSTEFLSEKDEKISVIKDAQHVGKLIIFAIPFFILLFLFFPRLPPLWHIPIPDDSSVTGLSDTMSPGDIAKLSQSSELAFRIEGDMQQLPERSELYWRALVLDQYDGKTWTSNFMNQQPVQQADYKNLPTKMSYQYLPADARMKWVTALEKSYPQQNRYALRMDWSVVPFRPNARIAPISMQWIGDDPVNGMDNNISELIKSENLKTPSTDIQTRQFAQQLFNKSNKNQEQYIENVLNWYKSNGFVYTLSPGILGTNRVDEFLFQSRQGFCEHYASSFVMLMRYVGIPARIVVGYQGGQLSLDGETWEVRQLDAHAWAEVYLNNQWVRYDPTSIIVPERIYNGMQNMISANQGVLGDGQSQWKYQKFNLINTVRTWSDYLGYQWQSKVVGYDVEAQRNWFARIGLKNTDSAVIVLIFGIFTIVGGYFIALKFSQYRQRDPVLRAFHKMSNKLPSGYRKGISEPIPIWLKRVSNVLPKNHVAMFEKCIIAYEQYQYLDKNKKNDISELLNLVNSCADVLKKEQKNLFLKMKMNNINAP